jgi:hypothetical protein
VAENEPVGGAPLITNQVSVLRFLQINSSPANIAPVEVLPVRVTPLPAVRATLPVLILAMLIIVPIGKATLLLGGIVMVAEPVLSMTTTFPASDSTHV